MPGHKAWRHIFVLAYGDKGSGKQHARPLAAHLLLMGSYCSTLYSVASASHGCGTGACALEGRAVGRLTPHAAPWRWTAALQITGRTSSMSGTQREPQVRQPGGMRMAAIARKVAQRDGHSCPSPGTNKHTCGGLHCLGHLLNFRFFSVSLMTVCRFHLTACGLYIA